MLAGSWTVVKVYWARAAAKQWGGQHFVKLRLPPITSDYQNDRVLNFSAAAGRLRPPRRPGREPTFPFPCRIGRGRRPGLRKPLVLARFGAFWRVCHPPAGARRATTAAEPGTGWRFHSRFQRASGRNTRAIAIKWAPQGAAGTCNRTCSCDHTIQTTLRMRK